MASSQAELDLAPVDLILRRYKGQPSMLLHALQEIQGLYTCVPPGALYRASRELELPLSRVYHVATFYAALSLVPRGKHLVRICMGTACHLRGAEKVLAQITKTLGIRQGDITPDGEFGLETVNCLGACALAPVILMDAKYIPKASPKEVPALFPGRQPEASPAPEAPAPPSAEAPGETESPSATKPTSSAKPTDSTTPTGDAKPIGSAKPTDSTKPTGSAKPTGAAKPPSRAKAKPGAGKTAGPSDGSGDDDAPSR